MYISVNQALCHTLPNCLEDKYDKNCVYNQPNILNKSIMYSKDEKSGRISFKCLRQVDNKTCGKIFETHAGIINHAWSHYFLSCPRGCEIKCSLQEYMDIHIRRDHDGIILIFLDFDLAH